MGSAFCEIHGLFGERVESKEIKKKGIRNRIIELTMLIYKSVTPNTMRKVRILTEVY